MAAPSASILCLFLYLASEDVVEQQYTSCMKVGSGGNLGLKREYPKKLFGPMFYSWWNCTLNTR